MIYQNLFILFFLVLLGTIVGSFLNVCIYRIPNDLSVVKPRSFCPHCKKTISWYDNIPVLSYFLLGGKCRNCYEKISIEYVGVELLTGILFALFYLKYDLTLPFYFWIWASTLLIVISFIDFHTFEIYDVMSITLIVSGLLFSGIYPQMHGKTTILNGCMVSIKGMVIAGGITYLLRVVGQLLFKKEAMGAGDIFLAAGIGAYIGWADFFLVLFIASLLGIVIGLTLRIVKGQEYIPFGPYLSMGTIISVFFSEFLWKFLSQGL